MHQLRYFCIKPDFSDKAPSQHKLNYRTLEKEEGRDEIPTFRGHRLNREDKILRRHILNLMTRFETSWESQELYVPFLETLEDKLAELRSDGLVQLSSHHCRVTDEGRPFLRNICMAFDARLVRKAPATRFFSQTI